MFGKLKIDIQLDRAPEPKPSLEQELRDAVELIESDMDSRVEWDLVRRVWNKLCSHPCNNDRKRRIKKLLKPVIDKYGQMDPRGVK